jgi:hypothetical protein
VGLEAGFVKVIGLDLAGQFIQVDYTAGFDTDPDDLNQYDLSQVPDWLETAAQLEAQILLNDQPFIQEGEEHTGTTMAEAMLSFIIQIKARHFPAALEPIDEG